MFSKIFQKWNCNVTTKYFAIFHKHVATIFSSSSATFRNIIEVSKIGKFQRNLSTIFLKVLKIYMFSKIFQKWNCNVAIKYFATFHKNVATIFSSSFATFENIIEVSKIGIFQRNLSTIFLKVSNIYLFSKIFQKWNCNVPTKYFAIFHKNVATIFSSSFATFGNIIEVSKIGIFQRNLSKIFLKVSNIHLFSKIFQKWNCNVTIKYFAIFHKNVATIFSSSFAKFWNIIEMSKISIFQQNLSAIFLKLSNIYLLSKIFQKWNCNVTTKYFAIFTKMLRQYFLRHLQHL